MGRMLLREGIGIEAFALASRQEVFGTDGTLIIPGHVHTVPAAIHLHIVPHVSALVSRCSSVSYHQRTGNIHSIAQYLKCLGITLAYYTFSRITIAKKRSNRSMGIIIGCSTHRSCCIIITQFLTEPVVGCLCQRIGIRAFSGSGSDGLHGLGYCFLISRHLAAGSAVKLPRSQNNCSDRDIQIAL